MNQQYTAVLIQHKAVYSLTMILTFHWVIKVIYKLVGQTTFPKILTQVCGYCSEICRKGLVLD